MKAETVETLIRIAYRYHPAGLWPDEPAYKASPEAQALTQRLGDAQKNMRPWQDFVEHARRELVGCALWDLSFLRLDPCYRLRVSLPRQQAAHAQQDDVVCLMSVLVPAYVLYASHSLEMGPLAEAWTRYPPLPAEFQPYERRLSELIESAFGAKRLPNEVLFTPLPDLAPRTGNVALGKARLIDLLFTPDRW